MSVPRLSLIDSDLNQIARYAYAILDNIDFNEMISMEIGALVFLLFAGVGLDVSADHLAPLRFCADVTNLPHDVVGRRNVAVLYVKAKRSGLGQPNECLGHPPQLARRSAVPGYLAVNVQVISDVDWINILDVLLGRVAREVLRHGLGLNNRRHLGREAATEDFPVELDRLLVGVGVQRLLAFGGRLLCPYLLYII